MVIVTRIDDYIINNIREVKFIINDAIHQMKMAAALKVNGKSLETTEEGFLSDLNDWNDNVAREIARINDIVLEEGHWEIVLFIRNYYQQYLHLPNARVFTKAIRNQLGTEKGNSRYLHRLFPDGPLKSACKIAGLPKPPTCL